MLLGMKGGFDASRKGPLGLVAQLGAGGLYVATPISLAHNVGRCPTF